MLCVCNFHKILEKKTKQNLSCPAVNDMTKEKTLLPTLLNLQLV